MTTFGFLPKWKEELVVTGPGGTFVLIYWMGIPTVELPDAASWAASGPDWARGDWRDLHDQLTDWCRFNNSTLEVSARAKWYPD